MLSKETINQFDTYEAFQRHVDSERVVVNFRLVYEGKLPAASQSSTRAKEKYLIRRAFHPQLRELWAKNPTMSNIAKRDAGLGRTMIEALPNRYSRGPYRFLPIIGKWFGLSCALDVLLLRRELPGSAKGGGDLDNRIKVLFDALRVPSLDEVKHWPPPEETENPFYCVMQDDSYVSELRIRTDQLLAPLREGASENDVLLIIKVTTVLLDYGSKGKIH